MLYTYIMINYVFSSPYLWSITHYLHLLNGWLQMIDMTKEDEGQKMHDKPRLLLKMTNIYIYLHLKQDYEKRKQFRCNTKSYIFV